VDRRSPQVTIPYQVAHAPGNVTELIVVPHRYLQAISFGQPDEFFRLTGVERKWLLDVNMGPFLQALPADLKVALWWRRNMHNIRAGLPEKRGDVAEESIHREPLVKLFRHECFPVASAHNPAVLDPLDLGRVSICDFTTSHNRNSKHVVPSRGSFRNASATPHSLASVASSQAAP